jgi:hypothetical protein
VTASAKIGKLTILACIVLLITSACSSSNTPDTCEAGEPVDKKLYKQNFEYVELVDQRNGQPGKKNEEGIWMFKSDDGLAINMKAFTEVTVRFCIIESNEEGVIAYNDDHNLMAGTGRLNLGRFDPNPYVMRVIVDGVLVKDFSFGME